MEVVDSRLTMIDDRDPSQLAVEKFEKAAIVGLHGKGYSVMEALQDSSAQAPSTGAISLFHAHPAQGC